MSWTEFLKPDWKKILFTLPGILVAIMLPVLNLGASTADFIGFVVLTLIYGPINLMSLFGSFYILNLLHFSGFTGNLIFRLIEILSYYLVSCTYMSKQVSKKWKIVYVILTIFSFIFSFILYGIG